MNKLTFDDILNKYFLIKLLRPATEWSYVKTVASLRQFAGHDILPEQVNEDLVVSWRQKLLNEARSKNTWNNKVTHMRALFNFAYERKLLSREKNPFNGVSIRPDGRSKKTLTEAQMKKIYLVMEALEIEEEESSIPFVISRNALRPAWYWLTVIDALNRTGMRQNQLLHIRLCDINFAEGWINLRPEGSKNHREHKVPITKKMRLRLERLYYRSIEHGARSGDLLFQVTRFVGIRREISANFDNPPLRAFFRRLSRECGFKVSPHRFRHSIATNMMKLPDRNIKMAQDLLGHSTIAVTLQYVETDINEVKNMLEELEIAEDKAVLSKIS